MNKEIILKLLNSEPELGLEALKIGYRSGEIRRIDLIWFLYKDLKETFHESNISTWRMKMFPDLKFRIQASMRGIYCNNNPILRTSSNIPVNRDLYEIAKYLVNERFNT